MGQDLLHLPLSRTIDWKQKGKFCVSKDKVLVHFPFRVSTCILYLSDFPSHFNDILIPRCSQFRVALQVGEGTSSGSREIQLECSSAWGS